MSKVITAEEMLLINAIKADEEQWSSAAKTVTSCQTEIDKYNKNVKDWEASRIAYAKICEDSEKKLTESKRRLKLLFDAYNTTPIVSTKKNKKEVITSNELDVLESRSDGV